MIFKPLAASRQQEGPASSMRCLGREVEGADGGSIRQTRNLIKPWEPCGRKREELGGVVQGLGFLTGKWGCHENNI